MLQSFVQQLKGSQNSQKVTNMIVELGAAELKNVLKSYEHFCLRLDQADKLVKLQIAKGW